MSTKESNDECNVWSRSASQIHEFANEMLIQLDLCIFVVIMFTHLGAGFDGNEVCITVCKALFDGKIAYKQRLINFQRSGCQVSLDLPSDDCCSFSLVLDVVLS